ncbi:hypothetical protein CTI14_41860, partial [Methylobacterium radiotolerans]
MVFVLLGLTVNLRTPCRRSAWLIGLGLAALLTVVIRPVFVGLVDDPGQAHPWGPGPSRSTASPRRPRSGFLAVFIAGIVLGDEAAP